MFSISLFLVALSASVGVTSLEVFLGPASCSARRASFPRLSSIFLFHICCSGPRPRLSNVSAAWSMSFSPLNVVDPRNLG